MNIWESYPSKGTHYETMKTKNLTRYTAHVYYGRDRDDWRYWTIHASSLEEAKKKAARECLDTMWTLQKVTDYIPKGE